MREKSRRDYPVASRYQSNRLSVSLAQPLTTGRSELAAASTFRRCITGMKTTLHHDVVALDIECDTLDQIGLGLRRVDRRVVVLVDPAREVRALPLVLLGGDVARMIAAHVLGRIRLAHRDLEHLEVGVELGVGVGIGDVGGEEHRGDHRFQLDVDAGLLAGLLDDGLGLLARAIDRGLVQELQLLAVLLADAIRADLPAGVLQQLGRLLDAEFPGRVLRDELLGAVEEIGLTRPARP